MSSWVTAPWGITPSKVAALMMRLRRWSGPSCAGSKAEGTVAPSARGVAGSGHGQSMAQM